MPTPSHRDRIPFLGVMTAIMILSLGIAGAVRAGTAVFGDDLPTDLEGAAVNAAAEAATNEAARALDAAGADAETTAQTVKLGGAMGTFWASTWGKVKPFFSRLAIGIWHLLRAAWTRITSPPETPPAAETATNAENDEATATDAEQTP